MQNLEKYMKEENQKLIRMEVHLEKANQEMGFIRDRITSIEAFVKTLAGVPDRIVSLEVNFSWIKWFVITSAGALIVGLVNLFLIVKS